MEEGRYLSLSEAAAQFGISYSHLRLLARTGKLKAFRVGQRTWVTTPEAVAAYLANPALRSKDPYKHKRT